MQLLKTPIGEITVTHGKIESLMGIWRANTRSHLAETVEEAALDISKGFHRHQFANLTSPWILNFDILEARRPGAYARPKPRITLTTKINVKGNLTVCWSATEYELDGTRTHDFLDVLLEGTNRPGNELIHVHDVHPLLAHTNHSDDTTPCLLASQIVLLALKDLIYDLDSWLSPNFEIFHEDSLVITCDHRGNPHGHIKSASERRNHELDHAIQTFDRANPIPFAEVNRGISQAPTTNNRGHKMDISARARAVAKTLYTADRKTTESRVLKAMAIIDLRNKLHDSAPFRTTSGNPIMDDHGYYCGTRINAALHA